MYNFYLRVEGLPRSLNKSLSRSALKNSQSYIKNWRTKIWRMSWGKEPEKPLEKAEIKIIRHCKKFLDADNALASFKPIIDGIVDANVIKDDSWTVTGMWQFDQQKIEKGETEYFEIFIKERA